MGDREERGECAPGEPVVQRAPALTFNEGERTRDTQPHLWRSCIHDNMHALL